MNANMSLVRRPERKTLIGKIKHKWKDNIKIDLREVCWKIVDCNHRLGDRPVVSSYENGNEYSGSIKSGQFVGWLGDS